MPGATFSCEPEETRIVYRELDFEQPWQRFNIEHELATEGVEKFAADYRATLYRKAS